jgi:hypothetical protein
VPVRLRTEIQAMLRKTPAGHQELLKEDNWSVQGRVNLLGQIAETYRHKSDWESARKTYVQAYEIKPLAIHKVFLCECLLRLNRRMKQQKHCGM